MSARHADSGTATLWAASAIAALLVLAMLLFSIGAAVAVRHRASGAADLAALAAAAHAPSGAPVACGKAGWVAQRMRAELVHCELQGWIAVIEVQIQPSGVLLPFGAAKAHARAGPTDQQPERSASSGRSSAVSGITPTPP